MSAHPHLIRVFLSEEDINALLHLCWGDNGARDRYLQIANRLLQAQRLARADQRAAEREQERREG